jgi:ABC-type sugar transport system, permease component
MKQGKSIHSFRYHLFCAVLALIMIYPVLWLGFSAFKEKADIFQEAGKLLPSKWFFENFLNGWKGFGGVGFGRFFLNSFVVTIGATVLSVFFSVFVAYGFARIHFKGRGFWFACMMMTLMLPVQVLMVPQYMLFSKLGWINTYLPLIIPYFGGYSFFIFLCVQFIKGIPKELDDAARIDGCGRLGLFFRLILPLSKSAMVTSAIFSFYWRWSDFVGPMLYLKKPKMYTVSVALKLFADPNSVTDWGAMFAMSLLSLAPVILVFLSLQKYIVEGISTTGLKG